MIDLNDSITNESDDELHSPSPSRKRKLTFPTQQPPPKRMATTSAVENGLVSETVKEEGLSQQQQQRSFQVLAGTEKVIPSQSSSSNASTPPAFSKVYVEKSMMQNLQQRYEDLKKQVKELQEAIKSKDEIIKRNETILSSPLPIVKVDRCFFMSANKSGKMRVYDPFDTYRGKRRSDYRYAIDIDLNRYKSNDDLIDHNLLGICQISNEHIVSSAILPNPELIVWNVMTGTHKLLKEFGNYTKAGYVFRFRDYLANMVNLPKKRDYSIQIWDVNAGKIVKVMTGNAWLNTMCCAGSSHSVSSAHSERYIFAGDQDDKVHRYNPEKGVADWTIKLSDEPRSLTWGNVDQLLFCGSKSGKLYGLDVRQSSPAISIVAHKGTIGSLAIHRDLLVSGSWDQTLALWDLRKMYGKDVHVVDTVRLSGSPQPIFQVYNQRYIALGIMGQKKAYLYDLSSSKFEQVKRIDTIDPVFHLSLYEKLSN